jgi:hypothetical protein
VRLFSSRVKKEDNNTDQKDLEYWLQKLIVSGLKIGISKRELLNDYYLDEIGEIIFEWNEMHKTDNSESETEEVYADGFFGDE